MNLRASVIVGAHRGWEPQTGCEPLCDSGVSHREAPSFPLFNTLVPQWTTVTTTKAKKKRKKTKIQQGDTYRLAAHDKKKIGSQEKQQSAVGREASADHCTWFLPPRHFSTSHHHARTQHDCNGKTRNNTQEKQNPHTRPAWWTKKETKNLQKQRKENEKKVLLRILTNTERLARRHSH